MARNRLVCKKCHVVFHMDASGHPRFGEAPPTEEVAARNQRRTVDAKTVKELDYAEKLFVVTRKKVAISLSIVGAFAIGFYALTPRNGIDSLAKKAQRLADAVSAGDLTSFKKPRYSSTTSSRTAGMRRSGPSTKA